MGKPVAVPKPVAVNESHVHNPANPHTHLNLVGEPAGSTGLRCMTGTLRPFHQQAPNSGAAFVRNKINPVSGSAPTDWTMVARRAEVILPRYAEERWACPRTLFETVDAEHPADGKALLTYITLTWLPDRLHRQWELGRQMAGEFARDHEVAVLLVHHVPGRRSYGTSPHLHLAIAGPRRVERYGEFSGYVPALMGDRVWLPVRERFRALLADAGEPLA